MFYFAEISCAINGIFIAEKLLSKLYMKRDSKALIIFGKYLSPILMILSYMSRYLFLDDTLKNMPLLAHMCIGLLWGFFLGSLSDYAKARIARGLASKR